MVVLVLIFRGLSILFSTVAVPNDSIFERISPDSPTKEDNMRCKIRVGVMTERYCQPFLYSPVVVLSSLLLGP